MLDQKRIAKFLATGLKPAQVASIIGCTPGYISQLEKDEKFNQLLLEEKDSLPAEAASEEALLENKYTALEYKILNKIEDSLPMAEFRDSLAALKIVGERQEAKAKRKILARLPQHPNGPNIQIAVLTMPSHAIPTYQVNERNQIISIGDRPMTPLSSEQVKSLFNRMKNGDTDERADGESNPSSEKDF